MKRKKDIFLTLCFIDEDGEELKCCDEDADQ